MRGAFIGIHLWRPRLSLRTFAAPESITPVLEEVRFQCKRASTLEAGVARLGGTVVDFVDDGSFV
jgi:hypothetical protein